MMGSDLLRRVPTGKRKVLKPETKSYNQHAGRYVCATSARGLEIRIPVLPSPLELHCDLQRVPYGPRLSSMHNASDNASYPQKRWFLCGCVC